MNGSVVAVCVCGTHAFSKPTQPVINLIQGIGVEGDAHAGPFVKHRSRVAKDPTTPNLRQVHLVHSELFDEVLQNGFNVKPGDIGENITTAGIDLLGLPKGTILHIGETAVVEITGLRNPCSQIDNFQEGLMHAMLDKDPEGNLIRKSGVMSIVLKSGPVHPGDEIEVVLPPEPHEALKTV
jgi:MOSC domain-containing protein YiiM